MSIIKLCLALLFIGLLAIPFGKVMAAPDQEIVGSWCVKARIPATGAIVPLIYNFSADGNLTVAASNTVGPATTNTDGDLTAVFARSPGLGEVVKTGPNEWEANYQYFDLKNGVYLRRFLVHIKSLVLDKGTDTISGSSSNNFLTIVDPNNGTLLFPSPPYPSGTLQLPLELKGSRMDKDNPIFCDLSNTSF